MSSLRHLEPTVLVLGSSGFSSYAQLGALWYLSYTPILRTIKTYVGCSVGAIIGLLLACGFSPLEIIHDDKVFASLVDYVKGLKPTQLASLVTDQGFLSLDPVKDYLNHKLTVKFGFIPTMAQLYQLRQVELVTVAVDIDDDETVYLSRDNYPNLSVVEAVLLSITFPIIIQHRILDGHRYIDGSFGNPYPIDYMDDGQTPILGIIVVDDPGPCQGLVSYLYRSARHPIEQLRRRIIDQSSDRCCHLLITVKNVTTTGDLLMLGMEQAKQYYT